MITVVSVAILFGIFFSFDLFFCEKKKGTFVRQLVSLFTVSIPALYNAISDPILEDNSFAYFWSHYFYPILLIVLILFGIVAYWGIYRSVVELVKGGKKENFYTFFDFIYKGYDKFKEDIGNEYDKNKAETTTILENRDISATNSSLREDMIKFINDIYASIDDADIEGYIGYILFGFVDNFLAECNARFTLRQLDPASNKMEAKITTKVDATPGTINIRKANLITKSMELKRPVFYSEFPNMHFKTSQNSIGQGKYEDYISYCLLKTADGRPYYSICLDVRGKTGIRKMRALVDSLIFEVICNAIALKILKTIEESESAKGEPAKSESAKGEPAKSESAKSESAK